MPDDGIPSTSQRVKEFPKEVDGSEGLDYLLTDEDHLTALKNEIMATFKEQMKLRKRLFNIEGYLMELDAEADKQHAIISEWEGKHNRLYRGNINAGKNPERPDLGSDDLGKHDIWEN